MPLEAAHTVVQLLAACHTDGASRGVATTTNSLAEQIVFKEALPAQLLGAHCLR
jgi:hypothetical protein